MPIFYSYENILLSYRRGVRDKMSLPNILAISCRRAIGSERNFPGNLIKIEIFLQEHLKFFLAKYKIF